MGVDDSTNLWKMIVQISVRRRVRRWVHVPFYDFAFQVDNDHVFWLQLIIWHSGWLDDVQALFTIDP